MKCINLIHYGTVAQLPLNSSDSLKPKIRYRISFKFDVSCLRQYRALKRIFGTNKELIIGGNRKLCCGELCVLRQPFCVFIFMGLAIFGLFRPLEGYIPPSVLTVAALYFVVLLGYMLKFPLEFIHFHRHL